MKPSDIASKIGKRTTAPIPVQSAQSPEHQAQIDQAWAALHPQPAVHQDN